VSDLVARLRAVGCVFPEEEAALLRAEAGSVTALEALVARRVAGEPLEQVLGWADFCGLRIALEPGVFVPRRRTEALVARAVELAGADPVVVDLCCGSGAIGAAIASRLGGAAVHAVDLDPVAVRCARRNLAAVGGTASVGDLDAGLPGTLAGIVDLLVACPPYVPTAELTFLPPVARDHEPTTALDGGADGLDVARRIVRAAPRWLRPGGHLLVEVAAHQAAAAAAACRDSGLAAAVEHDENRGATVVLARADGTCLPQRRSPP
jgi:release factor glutamine methyltransferase